MPRVKDGDDHWWNADSLFFSASPAYLGRCICTSHSHQLHLTLCSLYFGSICTAVNVQLYRSRPEPGGFVKGTTSPILSTKDPHSSIAETQCALRPAESGLVFASSILVGAARTSVGCDMNSRIPSIALLRAFSPLAKPTISSSGPQCLQKSSQIRTATTQWTPRKKFAKVTNLDRLHRAQRDAKIKERMCLSAKTRS
jgi:hypothetical protein